MSEILDKRLLAFWLVIVTAISIALITTAVLLLVNRHPPLEFSESRYEALNTALCPGELLEYVSERLINRTPTIALFIGSYWSVDMQRTVVFGRVPLWAVWTDPSPDYILQPVSIAVPDLPPGEYEYRVGAQAVESGAVGYTVPFTVIEGCAPVEEDISRYPPGAPMPPPIGVNTWTPEYPRSDAPVPDIR